MLPESNLTLYHAKQAELFEQASFGKYLCRCDRQTCAWTEHKPVWQRENYVHRRTCHRHHERQRGSNPLAHYFTPAQVLQQMAADLNIDHNASASVTARQQDPTSTGFNPQGSDPSPSDDAGTFSALLSKLVVRRAILINNQDFPFNPQASLSSQDRPLPIHFLHPM